MSIDAEPDVEKLLIQRLTGLFAEMPQVRTIALGGSRAGGAIDAASDIDLYIFTSQEIPLSAREAVVAACGGASRADLGLTFWGPGDEWVDARTGIEIDLVYFDAAWFEDQLRRLWYTGQASLGYTTCLWETLRRSVSCYDPHGWYGALQSEALLDYPENLRDNIIALNHPVLRTVIPSYYNQIAKAVRRGDLVSVNHRLAALLASYFDVLFAVNRRLHPGEKRMQYYAERNCPLLPKDFAFDLESVLTASADELLPCLDLMLDHLDEIIAGQYR